jgi:hypothetical protein
MEGNFKEENCSLQQTPQSRMLLEKLTAARVVKKFHVF